ncbi:nose resistant to fluoxetine protein 6-like [Pectinophora gossypiella]|uniref:nose resistant to fluoxetine protein 6-like n=1 Tax=Pectinophora gossypiella TaxID=13191 RepID=UPI00214E7ECA|nr:nose resistant to fluoxetine protein 6-like [Pectinophora gossypiella]
MISIGALLTVACACAAAADIKSELLNNTHIDKRVIKRLTSFLESNKTLDRRDIALLNRTAHYLDLDEKLVTKLIDYVKENGTVDTSVLSQVTPSSYTYEDSAGKRENSVVGAVEESPDYASSVVLASDLLSLTNAVARVDHEACREQGYRFLDGLLMNKRWALKMFDASAKSPQGLLFGSSYHLGNFDECIGIDSGDGGVTVEGQYCLATIKWRQGEEAKKIRTGRGESLRWAVCVPSACDAKSVAGFVGDVLANTVGNTTATGVVITEKDCYTKRPLTVSNLDVGYLSLILFFVVILFLSTVYEAYMLKWGSQKSSVAHDLIVSFSIINNVKKILSTKQNNALGLECVTGIKSLAMIFIIAGHACLFIGSGPVMDADAWDRLVRDPTSAFMLSNALLVDTFLFLSAFLFCRLLLIELDKRRGRLNILPILVFRYIRITPAYVVVILFYMTWLPKIGEGPLWEDRMTLEQERCQASWWANILYINNYVNVDKLCMFQSWYLSVDTQLFYIAPIFIYSLWRWRKVGPTFLAIGTIISLAIPAIITFRDRLDATLLFYAKECTDISTNFYFKEAYIKTHMKMTPYFMGMLTGYILHRIQTENYQLSKLLKIFGWMTSIVLGTVTTFSVSLFYQEWYQYSSIEAAAYISLHKLAWGIANGWLIIACATGNGGIFHMLLTWKFLVPISRLTYCAYLVNGIVELYYVGQLRHPLHVTFFTVMANAVSHLVLTFALALFLCITFESPIHGIEKILLRKFARPVLSDNARKEESAESSRNTSQSKLGS